MNRRATLICVIFMMVAGCTGNSGRGGDRDSTYRHADNESPSGTGKAFSNCYENFFIALPKFKDSTSAHLVLEDGKKVTLTRFFKEEFMSPASEYGLKDLDGDGTQELVIYNNTGGAHCCDEFFIFHTIASGQFRYAAHVLGGSACINAATGMITYSLSETLGYFFGCYACGFSSHSPAFKTLRDIKLRYAHGTLHVVPYVAAEEKQNLTNLQLLQQHGFEKVEGLTDNGWRKEFAMNLAVWHFNHSKNWKATKQLFKKYYTFKDAARVWKEFYATLVDCAKENTF